MTIHHPSKPIEPLDVIEELFVHRDARFRHLSLPMVVERQMYLSMLLASGRPYKYVNHRASMLLNVICAMPLLATEAIDEQQIELAVNRWKKMGLCDTPPKQSRRTEDFKAAARDWTRFLGAYVEPVEPHCKFNREFQDYVAALCCAGRYRPSTIIALTSPTKRFLRWASSHDFALSAITLLDIDDFFQEGRFSGWGNRTIKGYAQSLRKFFLHAEAKGWNENGLGMTVRAPISPTPINIQPCPPWSEIRRLIQSMDASKPSSCRAKAIVLLASIYGMRVSEIRNLMLEDLDWSNSVITITRAKRGRLQQYPMPPEISGALKDYICRVRPQSSYANVFLTLHAPYRPMLHLSQSMWRFLRSGAFFNQSYGLHSFRHACATRLLAAGTSLEGIADFLGHRSLRSVSIYAHCDETALIEVADFELEGTV